MKRATTNLFVVLIMCIGLVITLYSVIQISATEDINEEYKHPDVDMTVIYDKTADLRIVKDNSISELAEENIRYQIATYLPEKIIKKITVPIQICNYDIDADIDTLMDGYKCYGYVRSVKGKPIFMKIRDDNISYKNNVVLHEVGHIIDEGKVYSHSEEFRSIYEAESEKSGLSEYCISSVSEYFAQAFQEYYLNNEEFKENAPETFAYIELVELCTR